MSKGTYWGIAAIVAVGILAGLILLEPPQPGNVQIVLIEQFYYHQYISAALLGLLVGGMVGWYARRHTYHLPRDRGSDFSQRVAWRGLIAGLIALLFAALVAATYAAWSTLEPLAPLEKIILVSKSGLFFVVLAIAFLCALLAYALATRLQPWGGQYALIKRF